MTCNWGEKLVFALTDAAWRGGRDSSRTRAKSRHFKTCGVVNERIEKLVHECERHQEAAGQNSAAHWCMPQPALLHGVQQLARHRKVALATEPTGEAYTAGSLSAKTIGFAYPVHFDSLHANAWAALRKWYCGEHVRVQEPEFLRSFGMLKRHSFAAAAIFTVQSPENPYDLRVYHARWQTMLRNCSMKSGVGGGIFQRVVGNPFEGIEKRVPYVDIKANAGDLYLFNSENFHTTPKIFGARARTVLTAIVAYSEHSDAVEVYA